MVSVDTDCLTLEGAVLCYAGRTVLIVHALGTPPLPGVAQQVVGTLGVLLQTELLSVPSDGDLPVQGVQGSQVVGGAGWDWTGERQRVRHRRRTVESSLSIIVVSVE